MRWVLNVCARVSVCVRAINLEATAAGCYRIDHVLISVRYLSV
jgi:hypothetical protein